MPWLSNASTSTATRPASKAGPPSPLGVKPPFPTAVVMRPDASIFRIRLFPLSATYKFPSASNAIPRGSVNCARCDGPPSPLKPDVPVPATTVKVPFSSIRSNRWLFVSVKRTSPCESTARPLTFSKETLVARRPSTDSDAAPVVVSMIPSRTRRTRPSPSSEIYTSPTPAIATIRSNPRRASMAGPSSPSGPENEPVPAKGWIRSSLSTRQTNLRPAMYTSPELLSMAIPRGPSIAASTAGPPRPPAPPPAKV